MCKRIDYLWPALWTYLDVPGVEPTNANFTLQGKQTSLIQDGDY